VPDKGGLASGTVVERNVIDEARVLGRKSLCCKAYSNADDADADADADADDSDGDADDGLTDEDSGRLRKSESTTEGKSIGRDSICSWEVLKDDRVDGSEDDEGERVGVAGAVVLVEMLPLVERSRLTCRGK